MWLRGGNGRNSTKRKLRKSNPPGSVHVGKGYRDSNSLKLSKIGKVGRDIDKGSPSISPSQEHKGIGGRCEPLISSKSIWCQKKGDNNYEENEK